MALTPVEQQTLRDRSEALQRKEDELNQRVANLITQAQESKGLTLQQASKEVWAAIRANLPK